jgi:mono/diheme cytochrome c family protein
MKRLALALTLMLPLAACDQNMSDQKKYNEYKTAELFRNGGVLQSPAEGTVARGDLEREAALRAPPRLTAALLQHGRERYDIFCAACHGYAGNGDGIVVQRGMPAPDSLNGDRLRAVDDRHIVDVITSGQGIMYGFAQRVPPQDRWAITAYIRALQLSQHAQLADLPPAEHTRLEALPP